MNARDQSALLFCLLTAWLYNDDALVPSVLLNKSSSSPLIFHGANAEMTVSNGVYFGSIFQHCLNFF